MTEGSGPPLSDSGPVKTPSPPRTSTLPRDPTSPGRPGRFDRRSRRSTPLPYGSSRVDGGRGRTGPLDRQGSGREDDLDTGGCPKSTVLWARTSRVLDRSVCGGVGGGPFWVGSPCRRHFNRPFPSRSKRAPEVRGGRNPVGRGDTWTSRGRTRPVREGPTFRESVGTPITLPGPLRC